MDGLSSNGKILKRELINIDFDLDEVDIDEPVFSKRCRLYR